MTEPSKRTFTITLGIERLRSKTFICAFSLCFLSGQAFCQDTEVEAPSTQSNPLLGSATASSGIDWNKVEANSPRSIEDIDRHVAAQAALEKGMACYEGKNVPQDYEQAVIHFREAAEYGLAEAQFLMGWCYQFGEGLTPNSQQAVFWYCKAGEQGYADAQTALGNCYNIGLGVAQDHEQAATWYCKAAEQGHEYAQYNLGYFYEFGKGVAQDHQRAAHWYFLAAQQGHAKAQGSLGFLYANGRGVSQSFEEALIWYRKAAAQGDDTAFCGLGILYENGDGVPQDYRLSAAWYLKAAERGSFAAQYCLGSYYAEGKGVPQDKKKAFFWLRQSAEQGCAAAQNDLGICYAEGKGIPQDHVRAHMWFNLAASAGDEKAAGNRDISKRNMTLEQIAEAQRLAREWQPKSKGNNSNQEPFASATPATDQRLPKSSGTGFFISRAGHLITAAHVVQNAEAIAVLTEEGSQNAKVVRIDSTNDLAILQAELPGASPILPLRPLAEATTGNLFSMLDSSNHESTGSLASTRTGVRLGDTVFTVGFPNIGLQGLEPKLTKGEISGLSGVQDDPREYQISVAVQPGNSGGPLVDDAGNVVGVVLSRLNEMATLESSGMLPQQVNYAIKISYALPLMESIPECQPEQRATIHTDQRPFADVVQEAEAAVCLVLSY